MARIQLCLLPFTFKAVIWKYLRLLLLEDICVFLCWVWLDKKKSRRNLPFAFAVNLLKNLFHFFHALSASYSVGRAFQNKILRFFSRQMTQIYLLKVFSFLFSLSTGNFGTLLKILLYNAWSRVTQWTSASW